jgi:hypothetical protein
MSGSLLALCDLVESLEAQLKPYPEAARSIVLESMRCVRIELRSMRAKLATMGQHDIGRFPLDREIRRAKAELKWNRSILRRDAI